MTFWRLSFIHSKYLLALSGVELNSNPAPANPGSTAGGGDSPSYSGFSTVWQSLTTGVPRALTRAVYYHVRGPNNFSTGLLSRAAFSLTRMTVCLLVYPLRGPLEFISCPSIYIFHTKHDQIPSSNKINYPNVLFLGSSLFIYLSIHQLLLVAHCQLSSSTVSALLTLHLSRQHITAYLY